MPSFPSPVGPAAFGPLGWAFLAVHVAWLPFASWRGHARAGGFERWPSRVGYSVRVIANQVALAALALAVARVLGLGLLGRGMPGASDLGLGVALLAILLAVALPMWRAAVIARRPRLYFVMPQTPLEKTLWLGRALSAGIGEEITYRGVLYAMLAGLTGSAWAATFLQAAIFAIAHLYQDRRSLAFIFVLSVAMQGLVLRSGSLWTAVLVHATYDAVAGFAYSSLGHRHGYPPEGVAPEPAPATAEGAAGDGGG